MRRMSTLVIAGLMAAGLGTAASGQTIDFATTQNVQPLLGVVPSADFRVTTPVAASGFAETSRGDASGIPVSVAAEGAMTAPVAPGSGATLEIGVLPDAAMTVSDRSALDAAPASFTTADGQREIPAAGVQPLLGFNTTTSLTTSFTPSAEMMPSITLGQ